MNELEKDLDIDVNNLDREWVILPSLYFKYREEMDYVDSLITKKKMEIDLYAARLEQQARSTPKALLGVDKPTEGNIKNYVECDEQADSLRKEYAELSKRKRLLNSVIAALEMKRDALKNLVTLYNGEYFTSRPTDGEGGAIGGEKRNIRREIKTRLNGDKNEKN